jgi:hypothetical protein
MQRLHCQWLACVLTAAALGAAAARADLGRGVVKGLPRLLVLHGLTRCLHLGDVRNEGVAWMQWAARGASARFTGGGTVR